VTCICTVVITRRERGTSRSLAPRSIIFFEKSELEKRRKERIFILTIKVKFYKVIIPLPRAI
jgi:hypothetical protein